MLLEDVFVSADGSSDISVIARLASQNVKAIEKGAEAKTNIIVIRGPEQVIQPQSAKYRSQYND